MNKTLYNNASMSPKGLVVIGASAGGLSPIQNIFKQMPVTTDLAFVLVQHLSPNFKSYMDEIVQRCTQMPVMVVGEDISIKKNTVYVVPPNVNVTLQKNQFIVSERASDCDKPYRPIDSLFLSLAQEYGPRSVAVILSGSGSDGSGNLDAIHNCRGNIIAQDPQTAEFSSMPQSAIETGYVDQILSPKDIVSYLSSFKISSAPQKLIHPDIADTPEYFELLARLERQYELDFRNYRPNTILRRLEHRLGYLKAPSLKVYLEKIDTDPNELALLCKDLLIGVTRFFRDPDAFREIKLKIIPKLFDDKKNGAALRIWCAGCATGEEAYSLAMLLEDYKTKNHLHHSYKIFASDADHNAIKFAGQGFFSVDSANHIAQEYLDKYFIRHSEGFEVSSNLRKNIVFTPHNIIKSPPFTKMDLICCRNLLIYLKPEIQNQVLSTFHFSLLPKGILFLGESEALGKLSSAFDPINRAHKIFAKSEKYKLPVAGFHSGLKQSIKRSASDTAHLPLLSSYPGEKASIPATALHELQQKRLYTYLLGKFMPPSLVIDSEFMLVHTFGNTREMLHPARGEVSSSIFDMIDGNLREVLSTAIFRVKKEGKKTAFKHVKHSDLCHYMVTVEPIIFSKNEMAYYLIDMRKEQESGQSLPPPLEPDAEAFQLHQQAKQRIGELESELEYTRQNLQAVVEELETSNEELQASNEELIASNEELQSTNEELHSMNEEMHTVNAEYQDKIEELSNLNADLDNFFASSNVAVVLLDSQLQIRRFTPQAAKVLRLIDSDIGRPINHFSANLGLEKIDLIASAVIEEDEPFEADIRYMGKTHQVKITPYRYQKEIQGVVVSFSDVSNIRNLYAEMEAKEKKRRQQFEQIINASPAGMIVTNNEGLIILCNNEIQRLFGYQQHELLGKTIEMLIPEELRTNHAKDRQDYTERDRSQRRMGLGRTLKGQSKSGQLFNVEVGLSVTDFEGNQYVLASLIAKGNES